MDNNEIIRYLSCYYKQLLVYYQHISIYVFLEKIKS